MAQNYICPGEVIPYVVAGTAVTSGSLVLMGALVGVALNSGAVGVTIQVKVTGVFGDLPKATGALAVGDKVYFDNTAKNLTATATNNTLAGYVYEAAISAATVVKVKLLGS